MIDDLKQLKQELYKKDLRIKELEELATKDPLTGFYNRRGFEEETKRLVRDIDYFKKNPASRKHFYIDSLSLLFFDIDNFKSINDRYGHRAGDQILQQVSQIIRQKVRDIDIVGRWGGEELVVALVGSHQGDAFRKAEEIRKAVKSRARVQDHEVTVSVGVSSLDESETFEELVKNADKAMYAAKHERGKNNTVRFSELKP